MLFIISPSVSQRPLCLQHHVPHVQGRKKFAVHAYAVHKNVKGIPNLKWIAISSTISSPTYEGSLTYILVTAVPGKEAIPGVS